MEATGCAGGVDRGGCEGGGQSCDEQEEMGAREVGGRDFEADQKGPTVLPNPPSSHLITSERTTPRARPPQIRVRAYSNLIFCFRYNCVVYRFAFAFRTSGVFFFFTLKFFKIQCLPPTRPPCTSFV